MQELLVLEEILANIQDIGYILEKKDKEFQILGVPAHIEVESHSEVIQKIIQEFMTIYRAKTDILENYYKSLSRISALYHPYHWSQEEIENFLSQLFSCENPHISPTGKQILTYLTLD
jgi:DNA mismatch repair protein MutL